MKGVHIINDETLDKKYVQIEFSALGEIRKGGKSVATFLEDLEDMLDVELSQNETGKSWENVKKALKKEKILSPNV